MSAEEMTRARMEYREKRAENTGSGELLVNGVKHTLIYNRMAREYRVYAGERYVVDFPTTSLRQAKKWLLEYLED